MFSKHNRVVAKSGLVKGTLTRLRATNSSYFDDTIRVGQTRKIYPPSYKIEDSTSTKNDRRINDIDIQMLSKSIYTQVFKNKVNSKPTATKAEQLLKNLQKHGMIKGKEFEYIPDINFRIPILLGKDLIEHFQIIGEQQAKPYRDIVLKLLNTIPPVPAKWIMQAGWTRYSVNGESTIVPYPAEDALVFDVEVCVKSGKAPTLATAVSNSAWYAWISPSVLSAACKPVTNHQYSQESLIPLEEQCSNLKQSLQQPRIVIGHNVSYDRARIRDQYKIEQTGMRFLDTMSLHICIAGLTSYQRILLKSGKETVEDESWKNISSLNNLSDVHKLYCGTEIEKETRNIFLEGSLADINKNFQDVMTYCARDVQGTYRILKKLFPLFLERFPHPVTFAGMLELGTAYLPINSNWERYIEDSQQAYEDLDIEGRLMLARRADQACQLLHNNKYKENIWMWDQDWEVKNLKLKKDLPKTKDIKKITEYVNKINIKEEDFSRVEEVEGTDYLEEHFKYLEDTARLLPAIKTLLPGYPNWYRKLCIKPNSSSDWIPGPNLISTSMQITPKLLSLTWEGFPLHFIRGQGWGFLVPSIRNAEQKTIPLKQIVEKCSVPLTKCVESNNIDIRIDKSVEEYLSKKEYYHSIKKGKTDKGYKGTGVSTDIMIEDCCYFFKLPHKDGPSYRVGNPLAKDFLNKFSESVLAGDTESAEKVISIARMLSYWRNNRDRIMEQMVVWLDNDNLPKHLRGDGMKYGAILPQVVVCGTLTRRAVEPTWMTASNAHPERIGSELRAMVQAPPGYRIVGADVDSQELWIASVIGDAHFAKMHGATPLGWMTLSGNKADGTDMHSVTAKTVGISRDQAKVINYARIYGAGKNFAEHLLKQFNPTMSESEARQKATKMFALTKGKRVFYLRNEYLMELPDQPYGHWQAKELAKIHGKKVEDMFYEAKWVGGTESAMFNRLEEIAGNPEPTTPFLNCKLSRALEPKSVSNDRFLPTRVNWVVQSGAVDFLHLMLVCMKWIMQDRVRFCLSFHDELRYLVPEENKYQTALAMHVTNLLTRSFCAMKLGLNDLPQSVAFFSSVEIDTVLRKESKQDYKTPSNPHGLSKGYGITHGESLNIYQAVEKAGGNYVWWTNKKR